MATLGKIVYLTEQQYTTLKTAGSITVGGVTYTYSENDIYVTDATGGGGASIDLGLTGASVGDLIRVSAVDGNGAPTAWTKAPLCEIKTNPNLLDNWYFVGGGSQQGGGEFPINQRGQTSYSGDGYAIDRWMIGSGTGCALASDGVTVSSIANSGRSFRSYITAPESLRGKTVTLSILIVSVSLAGGGTTVFRIESSAGTLGSVFPDSAGLYTVTAQVPSDITTLSVGGNAGAKNNSIKIAAIKLELGSEQTLAHQENGVWVLNEIPDYTSELLKCQRYFQVFRTQSLRPTYGVDFRPVMATASPTTGTLTIDSTTYYTASSEPT